MAKIVVASRFLKPNSVTTRSNLVKYIATRESVEYYSPKYTEDSDMDFSREIYLKYISERPGVAKTGTHGLFSDSENELNLSDEMKKISEHKGVVWSHVVSLTREDAERLGYTTPEMWRGLVMRHLDDIAKAQKIRLENLRWCAAFHNTTHHPHIHLLVYSTDINEGFLTEQGIEEIKSAFANDMFHNELYQLYEQQTELRDNLREESKRVMENLLRQLGSEEFAKPRLEQLIEKLRTQLANSKGKKVYGYLQPKVKKTVDEIVSELAKNPTLQKMYEEWCRLEREKYLTYTSSPPNLPALEDNKVFKPIKNAVIKAVAEMCVPLGTAELQESDVPDLDESLEEPEPTDTENLKSSNYYLKWSPEIKSARKLRDEKEYEKAAEILIPEAEKGNAVAIFDLAKLYRNRLHTENSFALSEKYYAKALEAFLSLEPKAQKLKPYLQYHIGKFYDRGLGVEQSKAEAFRWFSHSANAGNEFAQFSLGGMYYYGRGTEIDYEQAVHWYIQAADKNNPFAAYAAAKMLRNGIGTVSDYEEAERYFRKAFNGFVSAEKHSDDDSLQYRLGTMLLNGTGCEINLSEAERYFEKSAEKENRLALYSLAKLYLNSSPPRNVDKAVKMLEKSYLKGNTIAAYALGKLYFYGGSVERNIEKAKEWLTMAAESGNEYAVRLLERMEQYSCSAVRCTAFGLLKAFGRLISDSHKDNLHSPKMRTESKLRNVIRRKKEALGIKESSMG